MVMPSTTCFTEPLSMISLVTRLTRFDGMAKPMPMDPAVPEDVVVDAMDELMPITWPAALKVGPPELPGLTAASICTALVTMVVVVVSEHGHRAVERGHDAGGGGVVVAERIADRHDGLADGEIVGIGEFRDFSDRSADCRA